MPFPSPQIWVPRSETVSETVCILFYKPTDSLPCRQQQFNTEVTHLGHSGRSQTQKCGRMFMVLC
jgi:hypothetical protein